ncbi:DNA-processing protein DprA, partial [Evtepia sp.]
MSNLRHWLWLSTRSPAPGMYAARILEHFGTPERAYYADSAAYEAIPGLPGSVRQALEDKDLTPAETILTKCRQLGIWILTLQDAGYPQRLRQLDSAPCVLYGKGTLPQLDNLPTVAIVGARQASPYGVMAARKFGMDLARQGLVVVSGSAHGVDAAALQGALRGGGEVVSVLGNGIDVTYPAGNQDLYDDVAAAGALLSEYPPGTTPAGSHLPVRNRILAGLSLGVLVVGGE